MTLLIFETAFETPFPIHRFLSPSRSSIASFSPVDAPDGTAARPFAPLSSVTSASIVGLPRESIICLPLMPRIALMLLHLPVSSDCSNQFKISLSLDEGNDQMGSNCAHATS